MNARGRAIAAAVGAVVLTATALGLMQTWRPAPFRLWPDSSFGAVVVDRPSGAVLLDDRPHDRFRSASLVKLLIAVDVLERPGPVDGADLALVTSMLRSSDDDAASLLWVRDGYATIVDRMVARMGLVDTEPPADQGEWGYTATSAADVARVYSYVLDRASPPVREVVMTALRSATRCSVDGEDQYFGIAGVAARPWAVKQGWSGFPDVPPGSGCTPTPPAAVDPDAADRLAAQLPTMPRETGSDPDIDVERPALDTSGVLGAGNSTIVVVLSLDPEGTSYDRAAARLDDVTRALLAEIPPAPAARLSRR